MKKAKRGSSKLWIIAVVLGLLIVASVIQAVELVNLKDKIAEINDLAIAKPSASTSSPSTALQRNLQSLPNMVGGC